MRTSEVIKKIENVVGRELNSNEKYAISELNDEGWEDVAPGMREILDLIVEASKKVNS
jgi:hypothetical protein